MPTSPMMKPIRRPRRLRLALVATLATGCSDAPTDPSALLVAVEAEAALRVSESLPTLPRLVGRLVDAGRLDGAAAADLLEARSLWLDAEAAGDRAASAGLRRAAYERAAPALAAALGPAGLAEVRGALDEWVGLAVAVAGGVDFPGLSAALADGRALVDEAGGALRRESLEAASALLLEAADRLRETTPGAVARRLIHQAEQGLATKRAGRESDAAGDVAARRAARLVHGAREALDAGDSVRAIRRAYYARQLLGIR